MKKFLLSTSAITLLGAMVLGTLAWQHRPQTEYDENGHLKSKIYYDFFTGQITSEEEYKYGEVWIRKKNAYHKVNGYEITIKSYDKNQKLAKIYECQQENENKNTRSCDKVKEYKEGKIVRIVIGENEFFRGITGKRSTQVNYYNEEGYLTSIKKFPQGSNLNNPEEGQEEARFEYEIEGNKRIIKRYEGKNKTEEIVYENEKLISDTGYDDKGNAKEFCRCEYDNKGKPIKEYSYGKLEYESTYNEKGEITKLNGYEYDETGARE